MNGAPPPIADLSLRMNSEPLSCPYCNAILPAPPSASAGQRVACPRCGDAFTVRQPPAASPDLQKSPTAVLPAPAAVDFDVERRLRSGRNTRIIAGAVLGGMAVMAALSLVYALYSQPDRRAHDTAMPPPPRRSPLADLPAPAPAATPPASLEALRWLPTDTTLVAGVQAADLRQTDAGRDLLNHLFRIGKTEINADLLERWTGLKAGEIDHVVLGVQADDAVPPRTVLVVRTNRPYDADAVKAALHAEPIPDAVGGKTIYRAGPRDGGLRPALWFADERTLVLGLLPKHLESVPDRPAAGLERLPVEVRELLEQRLEAGGPAWAVGHSADWRQTGAAMLLGALTEKDADMLGHVRDFAVQVEAQAPQRMTVTVRCNDAPAAEALEARLWAARRPNRDGGFRTARDGAWVTLQRWGDLATFFEDLAAEQGK